jgi:hypothetical protein
METSQITERYKFIMCFFSFSHGAAAQRGLWPPHSRGFRDHTHEPPQSVGLLWTSDQSVAETSTWQHTTLTTDKHPCPRRVNGLLALRNISSASILNWPASWSSGQSFWLLIMRSRVRIPVLWWGFFLEGEDPLGDHGLSSSVEFKFNPYPANVEYRVSS